MSSLEVLNQAGTIGKLRIPNRFVMSPMTRCFSPQGIPGKESAAYYRRRAEGQVGLIITEGVGIDHPSSIGDSGLGDLNQPILHGDKALAGWKYIINEVHAAGGLIAPQLWHQGPLRINGTGLHPEALSCRPSSVGGLENKPNSYPVDVINKLLAPTKAMSESDIADTIAAYVRSAINAKDLGFDAIAIHGAHGYLIDAFLWEGSNQRTDKWGGSLKNRMQYGIEVLKAIRSEIGETLPIIFRFSQWKQSDFSAQIAKNPNELEEILCAFSEAGVDAFDASARHYEEPVFKKSDPLLSLAGWAKKLTNKPTMAVGGIGLKADIHESMSAGGSEASNNIIDVAQRIEREEFDFACIGRALISEPEWPIKTLRGETCKAFSLADLSQLV